MKPNQTLYSSLPGNLPRITDLPTARFACIIATLFERELLK